MVVEGVHLSLNFVVRNTDSYTLFFHGLVWCFCLDDCTARSSWWKLMSSDFVKYCLRAFSHMKGTFLQMGLMKKHPSIIPFMIYIANEGKHLERFAVRAKYMTLDPTKNKYVKYIRNIRTIQDYLCKRADKHLVPKINNTNVDKSVAAIHATVFNCLRRREDGEGLLDLNTNTVKVVHQEYMKQYTSSALGSKSMFQLIQRKGSSRNLLAVMNDDGSVDKAWPLVPSESEKKPEATSVFEHKVVGTTLYGPLTVGSSEPVRLQFGNLGLSAWQSDKGTSSEVGSSAHNSYAGESVLRNGEIFRSMSTGSSGRKEVSTSHYLNISLSQVYCVYLTPLFS